MSQYDDYEDASGDDDDQLGTPPEYTAVSNRYMEETHAVLSAEADTSSYLDYDPGVFDDDAEGDPTPPDSARVRNTSIPRFNTEEAAVIANQLNELIDTRGGSANSAARVEDPEYPLLLQVKFQLGVPYLQSELDLAEITRVKR